MIRILRFGEIDVGKQSGTTEGQEEEGTYELVLEPIERQLRRLKRRNKPVYEQLAKKLEEIRQRPEIGEPKTYIFKGFRSVPIGPYVLLYRVEGRTVTAVKFDHHDQIYRSGGT